MSDELKKLLSPLQAVEPDPAEVGRWSASLRRPRRPLGLPLALAAAGLVLAALWVVGRVSAPPGIDIPSTTSPTAVALDLQLDHFIEEAALYRSEEARLMREEARLMRRILFESDLVSFTEMVRPHAADSERARLMVREAELMRAILKQY